MIYYIKHHWYWFAVVGGLIYYIWSEKKKGAAKTEVQHNVIGPTLTGDGGEWLT